MLLSKATSKEEKTQAIDHKRANGISSAVKTNFKKKSEYKAWIERVSTVEKRKIILNKKCFYLTGLNELVMCLWKLSVFRKTLWTL